MVCVLLHLCRIVESRCKERGTRTRIVYSNSAALIDDGWINDFQLFVPNFKSLMFSARPATVPIDLKFLLVSDPESVFARDSPETRQRLLDQLTFGLVDATRASTQEVQQLVYTFQVALQYLLHRLGDHSRRFGELVKERDRLFDEISELRETTFAVQRSVKAPNRSLATEATGHCTLCGNHYPTQAALQSHIRKRHTEAAPSNPQPAAQSAAEFNMRTESQLEASRVTQLQSEVASLKRTVEDLTVEIRVARELRRELDARGVQQHTPVPVSVLGSPQETVDLLKLQSQRLDAIEQAILRNSNEWHTHFGMGQLSVSAVSAMHSGDGQSNLPGAGSTSLRPSSFPHKSFLTASIPVTQSQDSVMVSSATSLQVSSERPVPYSQHSPIHLTPRRTPARQDDRSARGEPSKPESDAINLKTPPQTRDLHAFRRQLQDTEPNPPATQEREERSPFNLTAIQQQNATEVDANDTFHVAEQSVAPSPGGAPMDTEVSAATPPQERPRGHSPIGNLTLLRIPLKAEQSPSSEPNNYPTERRVSQSSTPESKSMKPFIGRMAVEGIPMIATARSATATSVTRSDDGPTPKKAPLPGTGSPKLVQKKPILSSKGAPSSSSVAASTSTTSDSSGSDSDDSSSSSSDSETESRQSLGAPNVAQLQERYRSQGRTRSKNIITSTAFTKPRGASHIPPPPPREDSMSMPLKASDEV
jgi:hypothetical protein